MIHRALKLTREFHRMKQVDLAEKLLISKSYLSEIESGGKNISVALLEKYSEIFNIPISTFFLFEENIVTPTNKVQSTSAKRLLEFFEWVAHKDDDERTQEESQKTKARTA